MTVATPVENVMIPLDNPTDSNGVRWLIFRYTSDDKDPWKWARVIKFQDRLYAWMSWNSDNYRVNYKEISESQLATIVRKR